MIEVLLIVALVALTIGLGYLCGWAWEQLFPPAKFPEFEEDVEPLVERTQAKIDYDTVLESPGWRKQFGHWWATEGEKLRQTKEPPCKGC